MNRFSRLIFEICVFLAPSIFENASEEPIEKILEEGLYKKTHDQNKIQIIVSE
jgi:hypothetical protein